jgi:hypothetical protein
MLTAFVAGAFSFFPARAAEPNRSWEALAGAVKIGREVVITRMNSADVAGKLVAIDGLSIIVRQSESNLNIPRDDVFRVRYPGARKRHAGYGALIGAGLGAVVLVAIDRGSKQPHTREAAILGSFLGAPVGAILGATLTNGETLYQTEKIVRPNNAIPPP